MFELAGMKRATVMCTALLWCTGSWAQQQVIQTLDRVQVNSFNTVLEMEFADPKRSEDFTSTGITGSNLKACELTALDGVFCLDDKIVRNWPDLGSPSSFENAVDCQDPALMLDTKSASPCTGLTVDLGGTIWIAGVKKGGKYSLIKAVRKSGNGSCAAGLTALTTDYCFAEVVSDRPLLTDLSSIDGDVAVQFPHGPGILGLEGGIAAVFFPQGGSPISIKSGKRNWNLQGSEALSGVGLLQRQNGAGDIENIVMASTTTGRVLATNADGSSIVAPAFDIPAGREAASVQCDFNAAAYRIRGSSKSGLAYVTDRQYCQVVALAPVTDSSGNFLSLTNATEPVFDASGNPIGTRSLTLSTADGPSATFAPQSAPTVAPGISIDLDDCDGVCTMVVDENGDPAATLANVQLTSQQSGLTLFQIQNIPDCRYVPQICQDLLGITDLISAGVVLDPDSTGNPAAQLLNMTPLLPIEVRGLFDESGTPPTGLPPMYMSRQYRGQAANDFTFDAFFGVTEEGVTFEGIFEAEFHVEALTGSELGCTLGFPPATPVETLLQWDTATTVSETYVSIGGQHVDTLINSDCGSSKTVKSRWSIVPYNTEITPCTYNGDALDVWVSDGSCPVGGPETPDDAVFAKLLLSLYDDLGDSLNQLACVDVDGGGSAPLSPSDCATLNATWVNGKDKLDKCWDATQQPKQSSGSQNCQSFETQLAGFSSTLAGFAPFGPDPANRKGELEARVTVLFHLYFERFVPSIGDGFIEP